MNVPLPASFNVAVKKPIDSRLVVSTYADLNNILNKYVGLQCYVEDEDSTYLYHSDTSWEKVTLTNIDEINIFNNSFTIEPTSNGKVIYVDSVNNITASFLSLIENFPTGFNVSIVQIGDGIIEFLSSTNFNIRNKYNFYKTSGKYSVVSILRVRNSNEFLLYGDLSE